MASDAPAGLPAATQSTDGVCSWHRPRLLPWTTDDGKPCLLSTDNPGGLLSRLADDIEAVQLAMSEQVLNEARKVLVDPLSDHDDVRYAGVQLAECLPDVLRVAASRGLRLCAGSDEDAESPTRSAEAAG